MEVLLSDKYILRINIDRDIQYNSATTTMSFGKLNTSIGSVLDRNNPKPFIFRLSRASNTDHSITFEIWGDVTSIAYLTYVYLIYL
jgi:hypothetical protein